jgi:hypothetical protein
MFTKEVAFGHKKIIHQNDLVSKMVGKTGFEPATSWSQTKRTTKLCYFPKNGAPGRSRTHNLLIRSQTIYPIDLQAHSLYFFNKKWWLRLESNQRHKDFQSFALPTELRSQKKWRSRRDSNSRSSA